MNEKRRTFGLLFIGSLILFIQVTTTIFAYYEYEKSIGSYWELADKSSLLEDKNVYVEKFIAALEASDHSAYNAVFFKNINNSFSYNLNALRSLNRRLDSLDKLDKQSFAYQSAMQQITAQEQGEASDMLEVLSGCWLLANHICIWSWIGRLFWLIGGGFFVVGLWRVSYRFLTE